MSALYIGVFTSWNKVRKEILNFVLGRNIAKVKLLKWLERYRRRDKARSLQTPDEVLDEGGDKPWHLAASLVRSYDIAIVDRLWGVFFLK